MMRRRMGRPGLIGTAARTAVIAGTASATAGAVHQRQANKAAAAQPQAAPQAAPEPAPAPAPTPAPPAPAAGGPDALMAQMRELADMHAQGVLSDDEFTAMKAKLLAS